jgi:hypothetical protein
MLTKQTGADVLKSSQDCWSQRLSVTGERLFALWLTTLRRASAIGAAVMSAFTYATLEGRGLGVIAARDIEPEDITALINPITGAIEETPHKPAK